MQVENNMIPQLSPTVPSAMINYSDYTAIRIQFMENNNGKALAGIANDVNIPGWMKKKKR